MILKNENNELIEKCEFLKSELKNVQGTKRHLMLCESRINILEKELEDKKNKLEAQNQTVNECVDIYVEENSENYNKILELKKLNEKYKIEINVLNDEITKLKNEINTYKNDLKNINATLDFYKSTHDELVNEFSKEEINNVYYIKMCEQLKQENQNFKQLLDSHEENKNELLNNMKQIKEQLNNCIKENYEIILDLELLQMQNNILKENCNYYKEREHILINKLDENNNIKNLKIDENINEQNITEFINKLNQQINYLQDDINSKSDNIISLKYQIKAFHYEQISKENNQPYKQNDNTIQEIVNLNNITYIQNNLFIYISLFKSVLFIISEILFFIDPTNNLYFEILTLLKLKAQNQSYVEFDTMIKHVDISQHDCENIFQSVLKSKTILREKLQLLQLKIC